MAPEYDPAAALAGLLQAIADARRAVDALGDVADHGIGGDLVFCAAVARVERLLEQLRCVVDHSRRE